MSERESGYYWVRWRPKPPMVAGFEKGGNVVYATETGEIMVAEYDAKRACWWVPGNEVEMAVGELEVLSEKLEPPEPPRPLVCGHCKQQPLGGVTDKIFYCTDWLQQGLYWRCDHCGHPTLIVSTR